MSTLPVNRPWTVTRSVAPLGLALYDPVTATRITTGLRVAATSPWSPRPRRSVQTMSGIHAFTGLLPRDVEHGLADPPADAAAVVTVDDDLGRFLPTTLEVPLGLGRVVTFEDLIGAADSPPTVTPVPLLSSPARELPSHVGAVRAQVLHDGEPAVWCRVRVTLIGTTAAPSLGVADAAGTLVVPVVYPAFDLGDLDGPFDTLSPPTGGDSDPLARSWPVQVEVRHDPDALQRPAGEDAAPALRSILLDQDIVDVVDLVGASQGEERLPDPALAFGADLVLQTEGDPESRLIVTAASP